LAYLFVSQVEECAVVDAAVELGGGFLKMWAYGAYA
jgi:hypothetical protein